MKYITEKEKTIPIYKEVNVVIAGGGPSGFAAAVAAARNGAEVLLVEKTNYVGGLLTCAPIVGFYNYFGEQVIFGIAQELVERLINYGASPGHIVDPRLGSATVVDTEMLKVVTQEMVEEAGVKLLFHTYTTVPLKEGGEVKGLIIENKSGRQAILAEVVIDATGDGDIAAGAGAEYQIKDKYKQQPGNLLIRMDNVNVDKIRLAIAKNPDNARTIPGFGAGADYYLNAERFILDGFVDQLNTARDNGDIPEDYPMRWCIIATQPREDEVIVNLVMATHFQSVDADDLTMAEIETRKKIPIVVKFLKKYIPGFKDAYLIDSHEIIGVRESRRIIGDYVLKPEDIIQQRSFKDGVAIASGGISLGHNPEGKVWDKEYLEKHPRKGLRGCEVPYRCLLPKGIERLLVTGRCISATKKAQNAIRVMAPCMALGQASGTAAALAINTGVSPRQISTDKLRSTLRNQGVYLFND